MARLRIGIDEAGRGPLAGPVAVGVVAVPASFNVRKHFPDAADSKVLSEKQRNAVYARMRAYEKKGLLRMSVQYSSAAVIDRVGIVSAVERALVRGLHALAPHARGVQVLLDGSLHAPEEYSQQTIIKGDATEPLISLASIAAKVCRDKRMERLHARYPRYSFSVHKGYGTKAHRSAIVAHGLSEVHRRTFCTNIKNVV